eukprot:295888-Chlamydomonas_euryale.AAC.1
MPFSLHVDVKLIIVCTLVILPALLPPLVADASALADLAYQANIIAPLDSFITNDPDFNWPDMLRPSRRRDGGGGK